MTVFVQENIHRASCGHEVIVVMNFHKRLDAWPLEDFLLTQGSCPSVSPTVLLSFVVTYVILFLLYLTAKFLTAGTVYIFHLFSVFHRVHVQYLFVRVMWSSIIPEKNIVLNAVFLNLWVFPIYLKTYEVFKSVQIFSCFPAWYYLNRYLQNGKQKSLVAQKKTVKETCKFNWLTCQ